MAVLPNLRFNLPYHISILIYGSSDSGKTVLASCSPNLDPIELEIVENAIMLDVEDGMTSLYTRNAGIAVPRWPEDPEKIIDNKEELARGIDYIQKNHAKLGIEYASLDSLDRYQEYAIDNIIKEKKHVRPEMQDWGDILVSLQRLGRSVPSWGVNAVFTCHSAEFIDENDRMKKKMPLLQGSIRDKIISYFDVVAYLEKVTPRGANAVPYRVLHTVGNNDFLARSRLGSCMPTEIKNPTIPGIVNAYRAARAKLIARLKETLGERAIIVGERPQDLLVKEEDLK